jgi:hypothetical protein
MAAFEQAAALALALALAEAVPPGLLAVALPVLAAPAPPFDDEMLEQAARTPIRAAPAATDSAVRREFLAGLGRTCPGCLPPGCAIRPPSP